MLLKLKQNFRAKIKYLNRKQQTVERVINKTYII